MVYFLVTLAWLTVVALGWMAWTAMTARASRAENGFQEALRALEGVQREVIRMAKTGAAREPVVVPAPDLAPYLAQIGATMTNVAKEIAVGVGDILNGRQERDVLQPIVERAEDQSTEQPPVWLPPWESDGWVEPNMSEPVDPFASTNGGS